MYPISFRTGLRPYSTYHRLTPWLIGFIVGYFLHKYRHLATSQKLEELRNRKVTLRKVRAISTPVTNCQCHRAGCLANQQKKLVILWYYSVLRCDVHCCTLNLTTTTSLHMYTNLLFRHYHKMWRNTYIYICVCVCVRVCVCVGACVRVCVCVYVYIHMYVHTYICWATYISSE